MVAMSAEKELLNGCQSRRARFGNQPWGNQAAGPRRSPRPCRKYSAGTCAEHSLRGSRCPVFATRRDFRVDEVFVPAQAPVDSREPVHMRSEQVPQPEVRRLAAARARRSESQVQCPMESTKMSAWLYLDADSEGIRKFGNS